MSNSSAYDVIVITTAALPWRTGPAYLSLWHACGLAALGFRVAYVIPWLSARSQRRLWGEVRFASFTEQASWLADEAVRIGAPPLPTPRCYNGYYSAMLRSIVPCHSVMRDLPPARVILLEEPEHLCWHPATASRKQIKAEQVIGIITTPYTHYVARSGWSVAAPWVDRFHRHLIRRHTDQVLSISPAVVLDGLDHPVRAARITGVLPAYARVPPVTAQTQGVYFLGRLVWDKGLDQVIELARRTRIPIDLIGDGPDSAAIATRAQAGAAPVRLLGPSASPWRQLVDYRVFFNPSRSEILCTATADALVAGRHAILPNCLANRPFSAYPNVHFYDDLEQAQQMLEKALSELPEPPSAIRQDFEWMHACRNLATLCGL
ncbi:MAG: hexosyltransferase [Gammaproteobacteria bacterium]|nr:hexosyltransferase [Gammaproteobacteria bacterium]